MSPTSTVSTANPAAAPSRIIIASRESRLAMWQARHVQALLQQAWQGASVDILGMTTEGDRVLDRALWAIGGKGQFIKELEVALDQGRADLAVHSLKDVPVEMPEGFALCTFMQREDPRDAFVSSRYASIDELPQGAVVGTSSLRREAQLRERRPDLRIKTLRGNLDTRLRKLDDGEYDAIILAAAGLKRLGMIERIRAIIPQDQMLPAVGQGILGIEIKADRADALNWVQVLSDAKTTREALAERAVSVGLGGNCHLPLAAYCEHRPEDGRLWLRALVAAPDGAQVLRADAVGDDPTALGLLVAEQLRSRGAEALLQMAPAHKEAQKAALAAAQQSADPSAKA